MKRFAFLLKSAFLSGVLVLAFAGCSKDEDESEGTGGELNGTWLFREANVRYYSNGEVFSIKETDPSLLEEMNSGYSGMFFTFFNGSWSGGLDGISSTDTYTVSGDRITIRDGSSTTIWQYKVSGKNLDFILNRSTFEMFAGALPDKFYEFDEIELILSFNKQD
jgi:uncharacterized lipoprotein YehR (DUF1307 family)